MSRTVSVGVRSEFPVDSVVAFVLRPDVLEYWLGAGSGLSTEVGAEVSTPMGVGTVLEVSRGEVFRLRVGWASGGGFVLRVTSRPGNRSRVRVSEPDVADTDLPVRLAAWTSAVLRLGVLLSEASKRRRRYRQAVVVIHGIGEQRPGTTLRGFVNAVFPRSGRARHFVKPDYVSSLVLANSVTVPGRWLEHRPTTDVYELYWAHLLRDTTVGQVYGWALRLLLAKKAVITPKLLPHVRVSRFLVGVLTVTALVLAGLYLFGDGPPVWVAATVAALAVIPGLVWKVGAFLGSSLQNMLVVNILGDAARYFDPGPGNVQARQSIRESGLELINSLHDRGRYDRIIVYGHSLGSVIAYDVLAHAWTRRSRLMDGTGSLRTPRLRAVEDLLNPRPEGPTPTLDDVRTAQHAAWREYRANGFDWRISDLVTAGSPLTHARWLLNRDASTSFDELVRERSLPTCPPRTEEVRTPTAGRRRQAFTFTHSVVTPADGKQHSTLVPHHAGMFALVRWTNVFFPHEGVMRGDPVGGPLRGPFGEWVRDEELPHPGGGFAGFAHTKYVDVTSRHEHADMLRDALALTASTDISDWVSPNGPPASVSAFPEIGIAETEES